MIIDNLESFPDMFKEGYRGVILLKRNKEGETGNAQRRAVKRITKDADRWTSAINEFRKLQQTSHIGYRIYSSVNSRNMEKAIHEFKRRQLEFDYGNNRELDDFYVDVENRFFSCLMNPNCRNESNFLLDCDSEEEYEKYLDMVPKEWIIYDYPTKNGMHIITKPFNPNLVKVEIKKDDLLFIG